MSLQGFLVLYLLTNSGFCHSFPLVFLLNTFEELQAMYGLWFLKQTCINTILCKGALQLTNLVLLYLI